MRCLIHKWSEWEDYHYTDEERLRIYGEDGWSPTVDPATHVRTCIKCGKTQRWGL